jgi:hypothetical protein
MLIELEHKDLVRLVRSVQPYDMQDCDDLTQQGKMRWTGNQYNESWEWEVSYLNKLTDDQLVDLFKRLKLSNLLRKPLKDCIL